MLRKLASGTALAAVVAVALVGCTPPEPVETTPPPTPTASPTATASSEAELLDDSLVAARAFVELVDEGFATGALPSADLARLASADLVAQLELEVEAFAGQGLRTEGRSTVDSASLVDVDVPLPSGASYLMLTCFDTSGVTTRDASGDPVSGGVLRQPRMFEFQYTPSELLITRSAPPSDDAELAGCGSD